MGTFNFNTQTDFTTGIYQADALYNKDDYLEYCEINEYEQDLIDDDENACNYYNMMEELDYNDYKEEVEEFNKTLQFYTLELQAGYHDGFQSNVKSYYAEDGERLTSCNLDNYATQVQYGLNLSTFKRKEQAEFNKIEKFIKKLFPQIIISNGWFPTYSPVKK